MKRKIIAYALLASMLLTSLTGCGNKQNSDSAKENDNETTAAAESGQTAEARQTAAAPDQAAVNTDSTAPSDSGKADAQNPQTAQPAKTPADGAYTRHPLYLSADVLKNAFHQLGFDFLDNGDGLEAELADVTFATWEEPEEFFGWVNDPIYLKEGGSLLRTRILPAQLPTLKQNKAEAPVHAVAAGRVYHNEGAKGYRAMQMEGFVAETGLEREKYQKLWDNMATLLLGIGSKAQFTDVGQESFRITVTDASGSISYDLGYSGPATARTMEAAGITDADVSGWVFVLDVDEFAVQYCGLTDKSQLYSNDVSFLSQFTSNEPANGITPAYRAVDTLREMGYVEVAGDTVYPDGIYVKMNMIQDSWDTNNQPVPLKTPVDGLTALRTVMTPAMEEALSANYKAGMESCRVFEVGHIYSPVEGEELPYERTSLCFMAYGKDLTEESFTAEFETLIRAIGGGELTYTQAEHAIAYEKCIVALNPDMSTPGNFGSISPIALENFEIGDGDMPAFMANIEFVY